MLVKNNTKIIMKNLAILECNVETLLYEKKKRFKPFIIKARALFMDKTIGKFNSLTLLIICFIKIT